MGTPSRQGRDRVQILADVTIGVGALAVWCLLMSLVASVARELWQFYGALVLITILVVAVAAGVKKLVSA